MGLKPRFTSPQVKAYLDRQLKKIDAAIVFRLGVLGEECVNIARNLNTYKDQTGNLRSSIGYVVVKDGKPVKKDFKSVSKDDGGKGVATAEKLAMSLTSGLGGGYGIIVVAGMNYASAVEAKGYDVLSSAEQFAKKQLPGLKKQLKTQIANFKI